MAASTSLDFLSMTLPKLSLAVATKPGSWSSQLLFQYLVVSTWPVALTPHSLLVVSRRQGVFMGLQCNIPKCGQGTDDDDIVVAKQNERGKANSTPEDHLGGRRRASITMSASRVRRGVKSLIPRPRFLDSHNSVWKFFFW